MYNPISKYEWGNIAFSEYYQTLDNKQIAHDSKNKCYWSIEENFVLGYLEEVLGRYICRLILPESWQPVNRKIARRLKVKY